MVLGRKPTCQASTLSTPPLTPKEFQATKTASLGGSRPYPGRDLGLLGGACFVEGTHTLANSLSTIPQKDLEILSNVQIREMNFAAR